MDRNDPREALPEHRIGPEFFIRQPFPFIHDPALDRRKSGHTVGKRKQHPFEKDPKKDEPFMHRGFHSPSLI